MQRPSSRYCAKANKETVFTNNSNVRVTRSRAKALGVSISPSKPKRNKRMASDVTANNKQKRRAVLKDVTNILVESVCTDSLGGGNAMVAVSYHIS